MFGKLNKLSATVRGDRVEIYRPLLADPRRSRKRRAAEASAWARAAAIWSRKPVSPPCRRYGRGVSPLKYSVIWR